MAKNMSWSSTNVEKYTHELMDAIRKRGKFSLLKSRTTELVKATEAAINFLQYNDNKKYSFLKTEDPIAVLCEFLKLSSLNTFRFDDFLKTLTEEEKARIITCNGKSGGRRSRQSRRRQTHRPRPRPVKQSV